MPRFDSLRYIQDMTASWPHLDCSPHRFGGVEWMVGLQSIAQAHPNGTLDVLLPGKIGSYIVQEGYARPHALYPEQGWVSIHMADAPSSRRGLWLLGVAYHQHVGAYLKRRGRLDTAHLDDLAQFRATLGLEPPLAAMLAEQR